MDQLPPPPVVPVSPALSAVASAPVTSAESLQAVPEKKPLSRKSGESGKRRCQAVVSFVYLTLMARIAPRAQEEDCSS